MIIKPEMAPQALKKLASKEFNLRFSLKASLVKEAVPYHPKEPLLSPSKFPLNANAQRLCTFLRIANKNTKP